MSTALASTARSEEQLNALVWCDHKDPALLEPFEKKFNVKVNIKEYEGTGTALSLVEQSQPGDWDVFVVDGIDVPRVLDAGLLAPLPKDKIHYDDIFPSVRLDDKQSRDGKIYAVTEKFGYNTVSFDANKVKAADLDDMTVLWNSDKFKGQIAVYDYYLPVMGLVAMGLGLNTATLKETDLPKLREALFKLKANTKVIGEVTASQTALATGETSILFGGGEWVTAGLSADKPNLQWLLPKQGGTRWSQSLGVFAASKNKDMAIEFVSYILSPEGQARLATSSCYWAMPANQKAREFLTDKQRAALRWDEQEGFLKKAQLYPAPDAALDVKMQDLWTEFLQH
ncbi:extracellular solute-binding protein [Mesorhizobium sp. M1A.F.Ca.IN.020.06.1.1]|nr:extracellular solute-binding protein [Mesorhizobium sp. M1A.F.Ca.IN.020.06.1.1]